MALSRLVVAFAVGTLGDVMSDGEMKVGASARRRGTARDSATRRQLRRDRRSRPRGSFFAAANGFMEGAPGIAEFRSVMKSITDFAQRRLDEGAPSMLRPAEFMSRRVPSGATTLTQSGVVSTIARKRSSLSRRDASACLRAVMSSHNKIRHSGQPCESRMTDTLLFTQMVRPCFVIQRCCMASV